MSSTSTDLLVIGGGPAGLSATLMFARLNRPVVMYDSGKYRNGASQHSHTIPGSDGESPADWRRKVREQVEANYKWVETRDDRVESLEKCPKGGFEAVDSQGRKVVARKVILATGLKDVLTDIPGLQEAWGNRAIHCVFCHGTESLGQTTGFLLPPTNAQFTPHIAQSAFTIWSELEHKQVYFFTHGTSIDTKAGLQKSGLDGYLPLIVRKGHEVVTDPVSSIDSTPSHLTVNFATSRAPLQLDYLVTAPEVLRPNDDAGFLTPDLLGAELGPMGMIPGAPEGKLPPSPPRMGDAPYTPTPGLFWAGNSGSPMGNIAGACAQGQNAAVAAAFELGREDVETAKAQL